MPPGTGCCCGCTFIDNTEDFGNATPTSGTAPGRLGPFWNVLSGNWQIVAGSGATGNAYSFCASAANSLIACGGSGIDSPTQYSVWVTFPVTFGTYPPAGAILRVYLLVNPLLVPTTNYIEMQFGTSGYVKMVGDSTHTVAVNTGSGLPTFTVGITKNNIGGKYVACLSSGDLGIFASWMTMTPPFAGSSFALQLVSSPSAITIAEIQGVNGMSKRCQSTSLCTPGPVPSVSLTLSGIAGSGCCSAFNGTFVLTLTGAGTPGSSDYSYLGTPTIGGTTCPVLIALGSAFNGYDQTTYTLTLTGNSSNWLATSSMTVAGHPDFRSSQLGTLTFGAWTIIVPGSAPWACTAGSAIIGSLTSLSDGPGY